MLQRLLSEGGAVVRIADCSPMEIYIAKKHGDLYLDDDGNGFVLRDSAWLKYVATIINEQGR